MSKLPKKVSERPNVLDAVSNTTAATGKGFAVTSAALNSLENWQNLSLCHLAAGVALSC